MQLAIKPPYLLFLGDEPDATNAKTAIGIAHWRPEFCTGQLRLPGSGVDLSLPDITPVEAASTGARSLLWGVASVGGGISQHWVTSLFASTPTRPGHLLNCSATPSRCRNLALP